MLPVVYWTPQGQPDSAAQILLWLTALQPRGVLAIFLVPQEGSRLRASALAVPSAQNIFSQHLNALLPHLLQILAQMSLQ